MDKVTQFLERHVQWFVLAGAAAYLGWMVYAYVYTPPIVAKMGPDNVKPGTVDHITVDKVAVPIDVEIKDPTVKPPPTPDVRANFRTRIGEKQVEVADLPAPWLGFHSQIAGGGTIDHTEHTPIAELPKPPAPSFHAYSSRWTVVTLAAPAAVAGAPAPAPTRHDVAYWSGLFTIDSAALTKEINDKLSKTWIPPELLQAKFATVELMRQTLNADGTTWTAPEVIKTLPIYEIPPYPGDVVTKEADLPKSREFEAWMDTNQDVIMRPAFLATAADAERWLPPGTVPAVVAPPPLVARPFDPAHDTPKTDEQHKLKDAYDEQQRLIRKEAADRKRAAEKRPGPGQGGTGSSGNGGLPAVRPPVHPPVHPVTPPPPATPTPPVVAPPPPTPVAPAPAPGVNPGVLPGDIQILVHDITIEEGRVYRYAVRYRLFNTLFNTKALATPEIENTFAVMSPDPADPKLSTDISDKLWTPPMAVAPTAHIFVTSTVLYRTEAQFEIFEWKDGRWHMSSTAKLNPGDPIGSAGKSASRWTVVDIRRDPRNNGTYVILMDNHGVLQRHDKESDKDNPEYLRLKVQAGGTAMAK